MRGIFLVSLLTIVVRIADSVSFRAHMNSNDPMTPLTLKYEEQVPVSKSVLKTFEAPDPKLRDRPVLAVTLPSGTVASVYSGIECTSFECDDLRGQHLKDVVRGIAGACDGFENATCTCALEEMGVTCICEKSYRGSGAASTLSDLMQMQIQKAVERQKKLMQYQNNILAGLPKDEEESNIDEYEGESGKEEYEGSVEEAPYKLIGEIILPKNEPGQEGATVASNFGKLRMGSCDSECFSGEKTKKKDTTFELCFAKCKLRSCRESRKVATSEEDALIEHLKKIADLQADLKPDSDDIEASMIWGANLKQLANLLGTHLNSTSAAASDAVMCEAYWLDQLDRASEADALRMAREAALASRSSLLSNLLGNLQSEVLAQRLREANTLLAALQQRFTEISGDALSDPDGSHAAADVLASAAQCRRSASETLRKVGDDNSALAAGAKAKMARCSVKQAQVSALRAKLGVLEEQRRNITSWGSIMKVEGVLGTPSEENLAEPMSKREEAIAAESARVRGLLLHMLHGVAPDSPCSLHTDCGLNQRCVESRCKIMSAAHTSKTESSASSEDDLAPCKTGEQCGNGHQCLGGQCSLIVDSMPCNEDYDCGNAQQCRSNVCVSLFGLGRSSIFRGEGSACATLLDCGEHQHCVESRCRAVPLGRTCRVSSSGSASISWSFSGPDECGNGQSCHASRAVCTPVPTGQPCGSNGGEICGKGQTCVAGACRAGYAKSSFETEVTVPLGTFCAHDLDCDVGQKCASPKSSSEQGMVCLGVDEMSACYVPSENDENSNSDDSKTCGNGQNCVEGACIATVPLLTCEDDSMCVGHHTRCVHDRCRAMFGRPLSGFISEGSRCEGSLDCGPGQRCEQDGVCRSSPALSTLENEQGIAIDLFQGRIRASDAPGSGNFGDHAEGGGGESASSQPIGTSCDSNADCASGERCVQDGFCVATPIGAPCVSDCGNGLFCAKGQCSSVLCPSLPSAVAVDTPCSDRNECGDGQRCVDFKCKKVPVSEICVSTDMSCGNGHICHEGKCRSLCPGASCESSEKDCGAGMLCDEQGLCVRSWDVSSAGAKVTCPLSDHLLPSQKATVCLARVRGSAVYPELKTKIEKAAKSNTIGTFCASYAAATSAKEKDNKIPEEREAAEEDIASQSDVAKPNEDENGNCVVGFARDAESGLCERMDVSGEKGNSTLARSQLTSELVSQGSLKNISMMFSNSSNSSSSSNNNELNAGLEYPNHAGTGNPLFAVEGTRTGEPEPTADLVENSNKTTDEESFVPRVEQPGTLSTAEGVIDTDYYNEKHVVSSEDEDEDDDDAVLEQQHDQKESTTSASNEGIDLRPTPSISVKRDGVDSPFTPSKTMLIQLDDRKRGRRRQQTDRESWIDASPLWQDVLLSGKSTLGHFELDNRSPSVENANEKQKTVKFRDSNVLSSKSVSLHKYEEKQSVGIVLVAKIPRSSGSKKKTTTLMTLDIRRQETSRSTTVSLVHVSKSDMSHYEIHMLGSERDRSSTPVARFVGLDRRSVLKNTTSSSDSDEWVMIVLSGDLPIKGTSTHVVSTWRMWQRNANVDLTEANAWDEHEIPLSLSWTTDSSSIQEKVSTKTTSTIGGVTFTVAQEHIEKPKAPPCLDGPCSRSRNGSNEKEGEISNNMATQEEATVNIRLGDVKNRDVNFEVQALLILPKSLHNDTIRSEMERTVLLEDDNLFGQNVQNHNRTHHVRRIKWELQQIASRRSESHDDDAMRSTLDGVKSELERRLEFTMRGGFEESDEMRFRSQIQSETAVALSKANKIVSGATHMTQEELQSLESSVMSCLCGWHVHPCSTFGEGSSCNGDFDCDAGQRCALEAPPPICTTGLGVCDDGSYEMCGNGEKCTDKNRCQAVREGTSCQDDTSCGRNQRCLAGICINLFGGSDMSSRLKSMYKELAAQRDRLKAEMEARLALAKQKAADELARLRALLAKLMRERAALEKQLQAQADAGDLSKRAAQSRLAQLRAKLAAIRKSRQALLDSRSDEMLAQQKRDREALATLNLERKMRSELGAQLGELEETIRRAHLVRAAREAGWSLQKGMNGTWDALSDWDMSQAISAAAGVRGDLSESADLLGVGNEARWEAEREAGNRRGEAGDIQIGVPPAGVTPEEWEKCKNESAAKDLLDAERVKVEAERRKWEAAVVRLARPKTCHQLLGMATGGSSGIYTIFPPSYGAGEASREHYHGMRVYCDMETDGGGWTLLGYAENGDLGSKLGVAGGSFDAMNRKGSANVNSLWIVQSSAEMAFTWTEEGEGHRPTAGLMSYAHGVRFPIPNSAEQTLAPDNAERTCSDPSYVSVPISCVGTNKCDMPSHMYTGTDSLGVCYGHAYGLVTNGRDTSASASCDWKMENMPRKGRAIMISLDGTSECSGVRTEGSKKSIRPPTMAIWVR